MSNESKQKIPGIDKEAHRAKFDYIKSNHFRIIHMNGVWGGNAPRRGLIQMFVWSERWPIPRQTVHKIKPDGSIGDEIDSERISRDSIVREVEVGIVMDINDAKRLRDWLNDKITGFERLEKEMKKSRERRK
jgi:hypothetical protein